MESTVANAVASFLTAARKTFRAVQELFTLGMRKNSGAIAPNDLRFATRIASSTAVRHRVAVWSGQFPHAGKP